MPQFQSVGPISGEDLSALPVKEIGSAVNFYQVVLGFSIVYQDETTATLVRDHAKIGLVRNPEYKPESAGSLAFSIDDLDALHRELEPKQADLGEFGTDEWDGKKYRTFFLREFVNGYCYCFYHPA